MTDQPFSNREIKAMFETLTEKLEQIHDEVKFTNGKVKSLMAWREQVKGASFVLKSIWALIGIFVIGMTISLFNMWVQFQSLEITIHTAIQEELDDYEFEIAE